MASFVGIAHFKAGLWGSSLHPSMLVQRQG